MALTGDQNIAQLVRDVNEFRPQIVVTADEKLRSELGEALTNTDCEVAAGSEAIAEAASRPTDWVMSSIVGSCRIGARIECIAGWGDIGASQQRVSCGRWTRY